MVRNTPRSLSSRAEERAVEVDEPVASSGSGRVLIDARGSIDSRTLNEEGRISSIAKDKRDRHDASVEGGFSSSRWRSHAGGVGFSGGVLSGGADYGRPERNAEGVPLFFKIIVPAIAILLIVVLVLAFS